MRCPLIPCGVVYQLVGRHFVHEVVVLVVGVLVEEIGAHFLHIVALGVYLHALHGLEMQIAVETAFEGLHVFPFKVAQMHIAARYYEVAEQKYYQCEDYRAVQIGAEHALVAYAASKYGHCLAVAGHARREEQHGHKDEQRTVQVDKVGDEIAVVLKYNFLQRSVVLQEIVEFLRHIEGDDYDYNERQCQQEGFYVFPQYIAVKSLHQLLL